MIKRLGIMGGSFNPVTRGHIQMGKTLLFRDLVDQVVFLPCGETNEKRLLTNSYRYKLLRDVMEQEFSKDNEESIANSTRTDSFKPNYFFQEGVEEKANKFGEMLRETENHSADSNILKRYSIYGSSHQNLNNNSSEANRGIKEVEWNDPDFFKDNQDRFFIDRFELRQCNRVETSVMMKNYLQNFTGVQPVFVTGFDTIDDMKNWEDYEFLMKQKMISLAKFTRRYMQ